MIATCHDLSGEIIEQALLSPSDLTSCMIDRWLDYVESGSMGPQHLHRFLMDTANKRDWFSVAQVTRMIAIVRTYCIAEDEAVNTSGRLCLSIISQRYPDLEYTADDFYLLGHDRVFSDDVIRPEELLRLCPWQKSEGLREQIFKLIKPYLLRVDYEHNSQMFRSCPQQLSDQWYFEKTLSCSLDLLTVNEKLRLLEEYTGIGYSPAIVGDLAESVLSTELERNATRQQQDELNACKKRCIQIMLKCRLSKLSLVLLATEMPLIHKDNVSRIFDYMNEADYLLHSRAIFKAACAQNDVGWCADGFRRLLEFMMQPQLTHFHWRAAALTFSPADVLHEKVSPIHHCLNEFVTALQNQLSCEVGYVPHLQRVTSQFYKAFPTQHKSALCAALEKIAAALRVGAFQDQPARRDAYSLVLRTLMPQLNHEYFLQRRKAYEQEAADTVQASPLPCGLHADMIGMNR